jgi:hypothetical protein
MNTNFVSDFLTLAAFNGGVTQLTKTLPATALEHMAAVEQLPSPSGGTSFLAALQYAERVLSAAPAGALRKVVIVSDSEDTFTPEIALQVKRLRDKYITVNGIYAGNDERYDCLKKCVEHTVGGRYTSAVDAMAMVTAMEKNAQFFSSQRLCVTLVMVDVSSSMDETIGSTTTKHAAAKAALHAYIRLKRRYGGVVAPVKHRQHHKTRGGHHA